MSRGFLCGRSAPDPTLDLGGAEDGSGWGSGGTADSAFTPATSLPVAAAAGRVPTGTLAAGTRRGADADGAVPEGVGGAVAEAVATTGDTWTSGSCDAAALGRATAVAEPAGGRAAGARTPSPRHQNAAPASAATTNSAVSATGQRAGRELDARRGPAAVPVHAELVLVLAPMGTGGGAEGTPGGRDGTKEAGTPDRTPGGLVLPRRASVA
jgi:hypothetical protein